MVAISECASIAGHFDGHAEALEHVQGYTRNQWLPRHYLLRKLQSIMAEPTSISSGATSKTRQKHHNIRTCVAEWLDAALSS